MRSDAGESKPRPLSAVPGQRKDTAPGSLPADSAPSGSSGTRPPIKRRTRYTARAAVLLLVFCALILALAYPLQQYVSQNSQIDKLKKQNSEKKAEVDKLRQELSQWQDPDYVKIQARERLHYVMPGETGLRLLGPTDNSGLSGGGPNGSGGPTAWYSQLWGSVTSAGGTAPAAPGSSGPSVPSAPAGQPSPSR